MLHYHINFDGNVHYISQKHVFNSVPEMINYHKHNSAGATKHLNFYYVSFDVVKHPGTASVNIMHAFVVTL